ncbi:MAG: EscU/YscU/HrcU family type III secretion system export apparatus switch protein [Acetobacteraceae bacterium]
MAEQRDSHEDQTEAATPRRLQRAREAGQAAISPELPVLAVLVAATLLLALAGPGVTEQLALRLSVPLRHFDLSGDDAMRITALAGLRAVLPIAAATLLAGGAAVLLQTGFLINATRLRPDLQRLNPIAGFRRLVGPDNLIEAAKSLVKLAAVCLALWNAVAGDVPGLAAMLQRDPRLIMPLAGRIVLHVLLAVTAVQAVITVLDMVWTRLRYAQGLRMSRQELRDEQKETEGDPKIKARIRQIRQVRARRRMLAAVPKATVVITNPTHYAVALVYDRTKNAAPRVVAKGVDSMAARIREVAREHAVPLVANPPLARALHRLEIDTDIPPEHYKAVAEIIAYVWRLRSRAVSGLRPAVQ